MHFVRQFSVFSNQFLVAALLRVINAPTLEQARSAKEILMNELGVIYRRESGRCEPRTQVVAEEAKEREGDPDLVSTEGTVDGGLFRFRAATSNGCSPSARRSDWASTTWGSAGTGGLMCFGSATSFMRLFGSEDDQIAEGASFAVENWAAAGFWQDLEDGLLAHQGNPHPRAQGGLFYLAQPRRGPARRAHHGRARRGLLRR